MKLVPKYKIARRLGAPIFEKTQSPKYARSLARKERTVKRPRGRSEFGISLMEKQKARFTYGVMERQFRKYVDKALRSATPTQKLFSLLEKRLDNVLYRGGLFSSRAQARQAASHGHLLLNGRRVTVPSIEVKTGDVISIRTGSKDSILFSLAGERVKAHTLPVWLETDPENLEVRIIGEPVYDPAGEHFDLGVVVEFYNR